MKNLLTILKKTKTKRFKFLINFIGIRMASAVLFYFHWIVHFHMQIHWIVFLSDTNITRLLMLQNLLEEHNIPVQYVPIEKLNGMTNGSADAMTTRPRWLSLGLLYTMPIFINFFTFLSFFTVLTSLVGNFIPCWKLIFLQPR